MYGLKQSPRDWYERLNFFLVENNFIKDKVDTTLFTKHVDNDILIVQIYVDDINFKSTNEKLCNDFESYMKKEFKMSMTGELNYFLAPQINQRSDGIFVNQPSIQESLSKNLG